MRQETSLTRPRALSLPPLSWAGHTAVSLVPENGVPLSQDGFHSRPGEGKRRGHSAWAPDMESSPAHSACGSPTGSCISQRKEESRPFPLASS